jgi:hypothetical protein
MYAAGLTSDALDVGGGALGPGAFVVKYDANGNFQWEYGPFPSTSFYQVRALSDGIIVVGGILNGSDNYGGGTLTSNGGNDVVLAEITSCKTFVRATLWGSNGSQELYAMDVDTSNNIVVGGRFENSIDFGGGAMSGPNAGSGTFNLFAAKMDETFSYLHQTNSGTASNNTNVYVVAANAIGDTFIAGINEDHVNWGGSTLNANNIDGFIARLDSSFTHKWSKTYGNTGVNIAAFGAAADPLGGIATTGYYQASSGTMNFGQGALPTGTGAYAAWFDSSGKVTASWGGGLTTGSNATANAASFLTWPDFIIAGNCYQTITLPSGQVTCSNNADGFVARLQP